VVAAQIAESKPVERLPVHGKLSKALRDTVCRTHNVAVIAEIKRRSPSRGNINVALDPQSQALAYQSGGAAGISVLTDEERFGGSADDLRAAKQAATGVPVLRKDFLRSLEDVKESAEMGADAVLLIVADLAPGNLAAMQAAAHDLGMDALVEVKDEAEIKIAADVGAILIAVNQRHEPEASAFTVNYRIAEQVAPRLPDEAIKVAASGIGVKGGTTVAELSAVGYDAVLVGEALMLASDPAEAIRAMQITHSAYLRQPNCPR
jgi:indole-3-glycerol phosphate synthase